MPDFLNDGERFRKLSDGTFVKLDRNGEIVEDGEHIHVPVFMMDAAKKPAKRKPLALVDASAHRPGPVVVAADATSPAMAILTPEQRAQFDEAYAKRKKRIQSAWKGGK